jgi:hypothetical protein
MERIQEIDHASIQKIIIIGLGLLMMNIIFISCRSGHAKCSAYDQVETIQELPE